MNITKIEWTQKTWNPASGCKVLSEGCKFCYAKTLAENKRGTRAFPNGFDLTIRPHKLREPLRIKEPTLIFVNSMSDLFWEEIPNDYRDKIIDIMESTPRHTYQVLTKRPERMAAYSRRRRLPDNMWAGTTIESARLLPVRLKALRATRARVRFLSSEPLLSPYPADLDLSGIHWVITGGESGMHLWNEQTRARRSLVDRDERGKWVPREDRIDWVRGIRDSCLNQGVAFFHKQWGGPRPKDGGRLLDGVKWDQYPEDPAKCGVDRMSEFRLTV